MTLVASIFFAGLVIAAGRVQPDQVASETDGAIVIDLPPADASSAPASNAPEGPEQQPAQASVSQQQPDDLRPPQKPSEEPKQNEEPLKESLPPPAQDPAAVLQQQARAKPPPAAAAATPPATPKDERAPTGADTPTKIDADENADRRSHATAHAISFWQKSLMRRLEAAKRALGRELQTAGTVKIAFEINARGSLLSERVVESSGSPQLDRIGMLLVKEAAPFPAPPAGAAANEMAFVVPVRVRR